MTTAEILAELKRLQLNAHYNGNALAAFSIAAYLPKLIAALEKCIEQRNALTDSYFITNETIENQKREDDAEISKILGGS